MNLFDLDTPIIGFPADNEQPAWTMRHAVEGVQIFGGIGSGKTSGSGRMLALKYLKAGFGGLVLTVKPNEKDAWVEYCRITGRTDDLLIIEPGGEHRFNFLEYISTQSEENEAITDNIVEVLKTVIRAGQEKDSGKGDDAFWEGALDMLIFNVIDLCRLAYGSISVDKMYSIVQTLPKSGGNEAKPDPGEEGKQADTSIKAFQKAYQLANEKVVAEVAQWYANLDIGKKHAIVDEEAYNEAFLEALPSARLLKYLHEFFFYSFKTLNQKTRSIIEFIFTGFLFRLLREPVYSMFCKDKSTFTPEDCLRGKIILINLPVKKYHKVGRDCQILFKYIWQLSMEKRQITSSSRLVFLWADESQNFLHEHDTGYQATARESRIATVYITQNLPNYYASMSGDKAQDRVKSLIGTLATKIFHANADIETNKYASELIGDAIFTDPSMSVTVAEKFSQSQSMSLKIDRQVRPEEFISLRTGSPVNNYKVAGYFHRQGDPLFGKQNFRKMIFDQNFNPNF